MVTPKVVVFDLGKVLVDFDYAVAVRRLAARAKMTTEETGQFLSHSPLLVQYETGLLSDEQFFQGFCTATGFRGDLDDFGRSFSDIFVPIEPMVELQAALTQQGIPTYIFSNTNHLAASHIRRCFPFFSRFSGYILSFEHGAMKPDAKLYQVVERQSGHPEIARPHHERALRMALSEQSRAWEAQATQSLGEDDHALGHNDEAKANLNKARALFSEIENKTKEDETIEYMRQAGYLATDGSANEHKEGEK